MSNPKTRMNSRFFLFLFAGLVSFGSLAQSGGTVRGQVIDSNTGEALPYVTIYARTQKIGTIANETGRFSLRVSSAGPGDVITISLVGYKTLRLSLPTLFAKTDEQTFRVEPMANTLGEVVVHALDPAHIVQEAIRRVSKNYPRQPARMQGFYREWVRENQFLVLSEGQLELYKGSYTSLTSNDQVRMIKGRRKPLPNYFVVGKDTCRLPIITQGPSLGLLLDVVRFTNDINFLDYRGNSLYVFEQAGYTTIDDRETYIFTFKPNPDYGSVGFYAGKVFIDRESLAIVRAEFEVTPAGLATANRYMTINKLSLRLQHRTFLVSYQRQDDGRYVLNHAQAANQYVYLPHPTSIIQNRMDFVVTQVTFGPDVKPFHRKETIDKDRAFVEETLPFDDAFWADDNVILENR